MKTLDFNNGNLAAAKIILEDVERYGAAMVAWARRVLGIEGSSEGERMICPSCNTEVPNVEHSMSSGGVTTATCGPHTCQPGAAEQPPAPPPDVQAYRDAGSPAPVVDEAPAVEDDCEEARDERTDAKRAAKKKQVSLSPCNLPPYAVL